MSSVRRTNRAARHANGLVGTSAALTDLKHTVKAMPLGLQPRAIFRCIAAIPTEWHLASSNEDSAGLVSFSAAAAARVRVVQLRLFAVCAVLCAEL